MTGKRFWLPVIASLAATPVCLVLGLASAGAGHGDYVLARILFPLTMLSAVLFDYITAPFVALAIIQFPIYGIILGVANAKFKLPRAAFGLLVLHVSSALICFLYTGENFS